MFLDGAFAVHYVVEYLVVLFSLLDAVVGPLKCDYSYQPALQLQFVLMNVHYRPLAQISVDSECLEQRQESDLEVVHSAITPSLIPRTSDLIEAELKMSLAYHLTRVQGQATGCLKQLQNFFRLI